MAAKNRPEWEKYYIAQGAYMQKKKKKQHKTRLIGGGLVLFCAIFIGIFTVKRQVEYRNSEYYQILKETAEGDYHHRIVQKNCAEYLNEKYGEGTVTAEDMNVNIWYPNGSASKMKWKSYQVVHRDDFNKAVYVIYLNPNKVIYVDDYQWPEIKAALEEEAIRRTGLVSANAQLLTQSEEMYTNIYADNPWIICPAFQTRFAGNLQEFFDQEYEFREGLNNAKQVERDLRLCGTTAMIFADQNCPDLRVRMTNPTVDYAKEFQEAMLEMEEQYHIDIFSAVCPVEYYQDYAEFYDHHEERRYDLPLTFEEDGKGSDFFYNGYAMLSWSYDTLYTPTVLERAEGIYMANKSGETWLKQTNYEEIEVSDEMKNLVEEEYADWTVEESFRIVAGVGDMSRSALIMDMQEKYPGKQVILLAEGGYLAATVCEEQPDVPIAHNFRGNVMVRDGYVCLPSISTWYNSSAYRFTILTK